MSGPGDEKPTAPAGEARQGPPAGETDLSILLRDMKPELAAEPYVFATLPGGDLSRLAVRPLGTFREREGVTVILEAGEAERAGLPASPLWALVTLTVHSSLAAVGFLAAVSARLAAAGIAVNAVAGYYHDHLFIPWERREEALAALAGLGRSIDSQASTAYTLTARVGP